MEGLVNGFWNNLFFVGDNLSIVSTKNSKIGLYRINYTTRYIATYLTKETRTVHWASGTVLCETPCTTFLFVCWILLLLLCYCCCLVFRTVGLDSRGSGNIIRFNTIENNLGAGVRLGGHQIDDYTYGVDNEVYGNLMSKNDYAGLKAMVRADRILLLAINGGNKYHTKITKANVPILRYNVFETM